MNKRLSILFCLALVSTFFIQKQVVNKKLSNNKTLGVQESALYVPSDEFVKSSLHKKYEDTAQSKIRGGITPHHTLASDLIAGFYSTLTIQKPDRILLIGPDHANKVSGFAATSTTDWSTDYGEVHSLEYKFDTDLIQVSDDIVLHEHSITSNIPFVAFYLPETKVIPLVVSMKLNYQQTLELSRYLETLMDGNTVIVAAVDFSHYLNAEQAHTNDRKTIQLIEDKQTQPLFLLGDDYLDSPQSIALVQMLVGNNYNFHLIRNTNSAEILNDYSVFTTSYISAFFY